MKHSKHRVRRKLTAWLAEKLPHKVDWLFQWLSRRQLMLLCLSLWLFFTPLITIRPGVAQQGMIAIVLILVGRLVMQMEEDQTSSRTSEYLHLFLIVLSGITTLRYLYYRVNYTLNFNTWINSIFCSLLLLAELYAIATLFLAYFQTLKIRNRRPVDLSAVLPHELPKVDIYIPTYNEDVEIVRKTALGALATRYPAEKQVYILDDGRKYPERREHVREMCEEIGCTLLTRDTNEHAKAGNINTALNRTQGDLVLILDCDHIPSRCFLEETVGFFFDANVALVQTPHWFYNPDPFERNLLTGGRIPVGNELFYKVLQKGNDFWNAAFFCGSAAVVRREALLDVGGIATETVTEDCHTSLRLHSMGYETVYYDKIMVAGLAPEKFSSYVGQQVRWARGMAQILRIENPMFNRKLDLRLAQRLCYFSATSHFFFGFPRLMYAIAPNLFLLFGISSVKGLGLETLCYALPHIILSMQTNHIPYKHVRFSFWNEIYEFALSFQAGIVTILALVNPRLGSFNVTSKGLVVNKRSFDLESVRYLVVLGTITAAALITVPFWLILSPIDTQAVLINALWCGFNLLLVLAACLVAFEQPQLRRAHRLPRTLTAMIHTEAGSWTGITTNVSETGAQILLDVWPNIPDEIRVELVGDYGARVLLDARIVRAIATDRLQTILAVDFIDPSRVQLDDLAVVLYSDVKQWYSQSRQEIDNPLTSLRFIASSFKRAFQELRPEIGVKVRKQVRAKAQMYWDGWTGGTYAAAVTEMGTRDLRLELDYDAGLNLEALENTQPTISLLLEDENSAAPQSLLAEVQTVEMLPGLSTLKQSVPTYRVAFEMTFPESLDRQQRSKIRQLLRSLN
ncbi:MAG: glycosyltransferase family 2 protein [Elainellaceae cyanobacterium]